VAAAKTSPSLGQVQPTIRLVLAVAAIVAGVAIFLLAARGIIRRLGARRLARKGQTQKGKFLVPALLYLVAVIALIALVLAAAADYAWT